MEQTAIKKLGYHLQDLVTQRNICTFTKFLDGVSELFGLVNVNRISQKFIYGELKNIFTFLKIIQYHPNSYLLAQALTPLFTMLLEAMVIPKIVYVGDDKYFIITKIKYSDLVFACRGKRIVQKNRNHFTIPYRGSGARLISREKAVYKVWVFRFLQNLLIDKVENSIITYKITGDLPLGFNNDDFSEKQIAEFSNRVARDYLTSDLNILPLEVFTRPFEPEENDEDLPEGY